jgi:hypothetical protein
MVDLRKLSGRFRELCRMMIAKMTASRADDRAEIIKRIEEDVIFGRLAPASGPIQRLVEAAPRRNGTIWTARRL